MIVDLTVKNCDGIAILASQGLIAAPEVDDFEPYGSQGNISRFVDALLIGATMGERRGDPVNHSGVGNTIPMRKSSNAAQSTKSPLLVAFVLV